MYGNEINDGVFFRDDEQAEKGLPIRNESEMRSSQAPQRQAPRREARAQRSVPMRQRQTVQAVLPQVRPLLMGSTVTTTFRD